MKNAALAALLLFPACASRPPAAPVTVVVIAHEADRADAARLRQFTEEAIQRYGASSRAGVVTIDYFGPVNRVAIPRSEIPRGATPELVYAAFAITDRAGNVLLSERLPYLASVDQLKALHDTANIVAQRVAGSKSAVRVHVMPANDLCIPNGERLEELTRGAMDRFAPDVRDLAIFIEFNGISQEQVFGRARQFVNRPLFSARGSYTISGAGGTVIENGKLPATGAASETESLVEAATYLGRRVRAIRPASGS